MMRDDYALFAAVVEAGSLSAAARRLHLSPPMVSKRLARLEDRLGARLLQRTTRRLSLTDVGRAFHERVVAILAATKEAEALVAGRARMPSGPLRVSAPTSFGRLHVAPHLHAFLERHPAVTLEIELGDAYVDLLEDRVDVAIRIGSEPAPPLAARRLAPNRRLLCAAPDYLARNGAPETLEQLSGHRLLAAEGQLPWRLAARTGPRTVSGESFVRTNSSEVVRELALAGAGIALRSTWDVGDVLASGRLVRVLPDVEGAAETFIHAVIPGSALVPAAVRAFIDHLETLYGPVPPWERTD